MKRRLKRWWTIGAGCLRFMLPIWMIDAVLGAWLGSITISLRNASSVGELCALILAGIVVFVLLVGAWLVSVDRWDRFQGFVASLSNPAQNDPESNSMV